jgi:hypothetical protein
MRIAGTRRGETYPKPPQSGNAQGLLEVRSDAVQITHFTGNTDTAVFVTRNAGGDPLEVVFSNWATGDVLEVQYNFIQDGDEIFDSVNVSVCAVVSIDGGATWKHLSPSGIRNFSDQGPCAVTVSAVLNAAPRVRLWIQPIIPVQIRGVGEPATNDKAVYLQCARYSGSIFPDGASGQLTEQVSP